MKTIVQYRYFENEGWIGKGQLRAFAPPEPALIPVIGQQIPLYPPTEGYGKVIGIEVEVRAEVVGAAEKRFVTIKIERI